MGEKAKLEEMKEEEYLEREENVRRQLDISSVRLQIS